MSFAHFGAEVRVAFDARTTKLHAKAWLLERGSGLSDRLRRLLEPVSFHPLMAWSGTSACRRLDAVHVIDRVRDDVRESLGFGALRSLTIRSETATN